MVVGLDLKQVGLAVQRDAHGIGEVAVAAHEEEEGAGPAVLRVQGEPVGGEVPSGELEGGRFAAAGAERKNPRDKREFANRHAIDEILPAAENGILDFEHVAAVGRNDVAQHGVGVETVVVGVGDLAAGGVAQAERGLKPAGRGVGEIGEEGAGAGDHDDALAFARGKADAVDFAGEDLAVHDRGQGKVHGRLAPRVARVRFAVWPWRSGAGDGDLHGLAEFRELADGKHHRVGEPDGGAESQLAFAGRGARGQGHLERDGFGEYGADPPVAAGGELDAHLGGAPLVFGRERGFRRVGARGRAFVLQPLGFFAQVVDFFLQERALVAGDPALMPVPEKYAAAAAVRFCPPTETVTVFPCWLPAG